MQKFLLFIFLIFAACFHSEAGENLTHHIFRLIYNQQYDSAHFFLEESKCQPDRFYHTVFEIDLSYWENVTGTDTPDYAAFEKTLQKYKTDEPVSKEEKIISLIVLSYRLRYDFKRFHFLSAIQTRAKTMALFDELKNETPKLSSEQKEIFRLYNALIMYFNHYPGRFFSASSKAQTRNAILKMETLLKCESEMVKPLSAYFLGKIYLKYEAEPEKGIPLFSFLSEKYPNNQKFPEYLNECRKKSND